MKKILLIFVLSLLFNFSSKANDAHFGVDLGWGFVDLKAADTAQTIANLSGSTVTYTYDEAALVGRAYFDAEIADNILAEIGYFLSGDMSATYTIGSASASETYNTSGIDAAVVYKPNDEGAFFKAGMHSSELDGALDVTIDGTKYNIAQESANGIGYLVGAGFDFDENYRVGYTFYTSIGGIADADIGLLYIGYRF